MISPYAPPSELIEFLPLMTKDEMEQLLKTINELLRLEQDGQKIMRLLDNRDILEKAIDKY
ncbi:hypothetical protein [Desulforamulus hydrothermalis]|uniref:Uncharacterized protein n=1 Tax=Desulforamulus hydrothermalis Lam5 = DSM 18033 TaxID=1121428 RepID=K8EFK2_9FIRM|nr:hypothetical protein [Desulforamulus hydrothermalis]CCO07461.1 conserved hypothetical protein [Desulforamulus hydrothermalis Lam5 = DSM 18033]SHH17993.1 hypothetical protein SAMN02745177_01733 [Desulforamulus hydrothermalis Lam5 = DSM 18033]